MADKLFTVELTASFLERLDAIETFLLAANAGFAYDALLAELRATVIPNLRRFPRPRCLPVHRRRCVNTCTETT